MTNRNKAGFAITEAQLITEAHAAAKINCTAYVAHGWSGTFRNRFGARRLHAATKLRERGVIEHVVAEHDHGPNRNIVTDRFRLTPEWLERLDMEDYAIERDLPVTQDGKFLAFKRIK